MVEPFRPAFIHDYHLEVTQGEDFVIGFRALPRTDQGALYLEDTTGFTATLTIRDRNPDGDIQHVATVANGQIQVGFTPAAWEASTAYGLGQQVVPTALNGFVYEVTVAGTSDSGEPTWPTTIGGTVNDGTVTWRCELTDARVANVYIHIPGSVTDDLEDWGYGEYALSVKDAFGNSWCYVDGTVRLRRSANV